MSIPRLFGVLHTLERITRPPRMGHDVDVPVEPLCCCADGPEFICAPCSYEDHGECERTGGDDLTERPIRCPECGAELASGTTQCPECHSMITEPGLTDDELVAVRGLIQERYEDASAAPHPADNPAAGDTPRSPAAGPLSPFAQGVEASRTELVGCPECDDWPFVITFPNGATRYICQDHGVIGASFTTK